MHNVIVLGAGASVSAGAPVMRSFIDEADRVRLTSTDIDRAAFDDVFKAVAELQPVFMKAHVDIENIESLFGAIDMGNLIDRFGGRTSASIQLLRISIATMIVQTLEQCMRFPTTPNGRFRASPPMQILAHTMQIAMARRDQEIVRDTFAVLTFNYDILADVALDAAGIHYSYALDPTDSADHVPLLKLHGSINWRLCPTCKMVAARPTTEYYMTPDQRGPARFPISTMSVDHAKCAAQLQGAPFIVPPTWDKGSHHHSIGRVWSRAATELARAERIYIIGYSLPESDSFFRYLYALGTTGETRLQRVYVVNPDVGALKERYASLFGRGILDRIEYVDATLEDFAPEFADSFQARHALSNVGYGLPTITRAARRV